jgi:hypothetical protein
MSATARYVLETDSHNARANSGLAADRRGAAAASGIRLFTKDNAFDDPDFEPLRVLDGQRQVLRLDKRTPQVVLTGNWHCEDFQCALDGTNDSRRACDVINEDQSSAGPQNSCHLAQSGADVGDCAQSEGANDGVEGLIAERQRLRITVAKLDPTAHLTPGSGRPTASAH